MKRWSLISIAVTVLVLGVSAVGWSRVAPAGPSIPTAPLQRGQVAVRVNAIGDLRVPRSLRDVRADFVERRVLHRSPLTRSPSAPDLCQHQRGAGTSGPWSYRALP